VCASGFFALGWDAWGMTALGVNAAYGCHAYAWHVAVSPDGPAKWAAFAPHANDAIAHGFFARLPLPPFLFHGRPNILALVLPILPAFIWEMLWELMKRRPRTTIAASQL
jgi:hypothetical protein